MTQSAIRRFSLPLLFLLAFALPGCGSVVGIATDDVSPIYAGVVNDYNLLAMAASDEGTGNARLWAVGAILDAPLSFAMDTALLPFTVIAHYLR